MYSIKNNEDLEKLEELASLQNQLGKQIFHEDMKKVVEPVTKSLEKTSQDITKAITETSIKINEAISDLNEKLLDLMKDKSMIDPYLASSLVNLFKPENESQFRFKKRS